MPWILFLHSQEIEKVIPWMSYLLRIQEREIQEGFLEEETAQDCSVPGFEDGSAAEFLDDQILRMTNFLTHLSEGMKEPRASLVCVLPVPAALSSPDCYGSPFLLCATSIRATGHE